MEIGFWRSPGFVRCKLSVSIWDLGMGGMGSDAYIVKMPGVSTLKN